MIRKLHCLLLKAMIPPVTDIDDVVQQMQWKMEQVKAEETAKKTEQLAQRLLFGDCGPDGLRPPVQPPNLSDDIVFCLYRLLMVVPWSADSVADTPEGIERELAHLLGDAFDQTTTHYHRVRGVANMWVEWAATNGLRLFLAWREDASANHHTQALGTGPPPTTPQ